MPKDAGGFCKSKARKDGLATYCKECDRVYRKEHREWMVAYQKVWWEKNRVKLSPHRKACRLVLRYGLPPGDIERMFAEQGGGCAICSGPGGKRGLCVDHDHKTGKVRALLCFSCNTAIGHLKESSAVAQIAADYLKRHGK